MKKVRIIFGVLAFLSFVLMLGTCGAVECNTITVAQGVIRICVVLPILAVSVYIVKRF